MTARLLCLLPDLDGGGAQRTMVNLVNALPAQGFDVRLAVARTGGPAAAWLREPERLVDLGCRRTLAAPLPLRRLVRQWRPDALFSTMVDANLVASLATLEMAGRPALVLRETNSHRARGDLSWLRRRVIGWAYRRAEAVVALSSGVERELAADYGLDRSRLVTLPNPVEVAAIGTRVEASSPFAVSNRPVVLGVGRLTRQKGFDLLVEAVARMPAPRPRVVLLGDGDDRGALAAQAARLGVNLDLPGFVADPAPWMAACDLFVLSSRWEGFGHVIVEAMACGAPVVAFDCPHGPADIIRDGETGMLIDNGDLDGLARSIGALLADPSRRHSLATAGRAAAQDFQTETVAARYAEVIRSALSRR